MADTDYLKNQNYEPPAIPTYKTTDTQSGWSSSQKGTLAKRTEITDELSSAGGTLSAGEAGAAAKRKADLIGVEGSVAAPTPESQLGEQNALFTLANKNINDYIELTNGQLQHLNGYMPEAVPEYKNVEVPGELKQGEMGPPKSEMIRAKVEGALPERVPGVIEQTQQKLIRSNEALMASQEAFKNYKIEPLKDMGVARSMGLAIMAGIGSFAQGIGGGPNQAINIMNKAIDVSMEKQKLEYQQLLQSVQMSEKQRNYLVNQLDNLFNKKKEMTLRLGQLQASAIANSDKKLSTKVAAAEMINKIDEYIRKLNFQNEKDVVKLKTDLLGTSTSRGGSTTKEAVDPFALQKQKDEAKAKAPQKITDKAKEKVIDSVNAMRALKKVKDYYNKVGPLKLPQWSRKDVKEFNSLLTNYVLIKQRATSGLTVTEQEREAIKSSLPSGRVVLPWVGESQEIGNKLWKNEEESIRSYTQDLMRANPGTENFFKKEDLSYVQGNAAPKNVQSEDDWLKSIGGRKNK